MQSCVHTHDCMYVNINIDMENMFGHCTENNIYTYTYCNMYTFIRIRLIRIRKVYFQNHNCIYRQNSKYQHGLRKRSYCLC